MTLTKTHPLNVQRKFCPAKNEIEPAGGAPFIYISPPLVTRRHCFWRRGQFALAMPRADPKDDQRQV